jgi:thymidine phosphorylase
MDTEAIGRILVELGGGRKKVTDTVDPGVGLIFHRKLGAKVLPGDPICTVYAREDQDLAPLEKTFLDALEVSGARKQVQKLILEQI